MVSESSSIKYTKLFINNEFVDAASKKTFPSFNPCNGQKIADVAEADKEDVDKAVAAAKTAGKLINQLADLLQRDLKELARLETLDNGKPLSDSEFDIQCSVDVLRYYAGYCDKVHGHTIPSDGDFFTLTRKEPIGVVGQIIPWNYPLMMLAWNPAALAREAGFPAGVINVVPGYGPTAGAALALHGDVSKVAFTGSTQSWGARVRLSYSTTSIWTRRWRSLATRFLPITAKTVAPALERSSSRGIYDAFVKKAVEKARARKVGDPFDAGVQQGPQIDKPSLDKILRLVASGKEQGAKLETGAHRSAPKDTSYSPPSSRTLPIKCRSLKRRFLGRCKPF
ncbi:hypothetical protein MTP99_003620 [Tenebrio molitor]|nr:hypothetical protein MTP99_003620 [Tenebrio molitor]